MAITKDGGGTLTQLTSSGNSGEISLAAHHALTVSLRHTNGTGTISAQATAWPQVSHDGTNWYNDGAQPIGFGTTASAAVPATYTPPADGLTIQKVRFVYVAPTGSTGHTLDIAYSRTAIS